MGRISSHTYLSEINHVIYSSFILALYYYKYITFTALFCITMLFNCLSCTCMIDHNHTHYITRVLTLHATVAPFNTCSGLFWQPRTCMFRFSNEERGCGSGTRRTIVLPAGDHRLPAQLALAFSQPILSIFIRLAGNYIQFCMIIYSCTSDVILL